MSTTDAIEVTDGGGEPSGTRLKLDDPSLYLNRELSWLDFNLRVIELTEDSSVPLLERVRFAAIYTSNLDEYFMVRVAGLHDQIDAGVDRPSVDGLTPLQTLELVHERTLEHSVRLQRCVAQRLMPALAERGIVIKRVSELSDAEREALGAHFRRVIFPALTPLAVGPGQPFPYISTLSLSLGVIVSDPEVSEAHWSVAMLPLPSSALCRTAGVRP